jgi:hypothetical protein
VSTNGTYPDVLPARLACNRSLVYLLEREVGAPDRFVRDGPRSLLRARLGIRPSTASVSFTRRERAMSTFTSTSTSANVPSVIVEIRAAEGGDDAKLLVDEQLGIYARRALLHGL